MLWQSSGRLRLTPPNLYGLISPTVSAHNVEESSQTATASDAEVLAYMQRQLRSGRVKPGVLVSLTQTAFADVSHERIVECFKQLDSTLLKR